jgi:hypothetical protein
VEVVVLAHALRNRNRKGRRGPEVARPHGGTDSTG